MFPTTHDPASPLRILTPAFNPITEQYSRAAGARRAWGCGRLPQPSLSREHPASAMKPRDRGASPGSPRGEPRGGRSVPQRGELP